MRKPLSVLIVEDSEDDALLLVRQLRDGGFEPTFERVDTAEEMSAALDSQAWDIVITDYMMPRFSGEASLKLLKSKRLDLPIIVMSGKIGEETAAEIIKAGAKNYIAKGNTARLIPVINRELREAEMRRERKRAEKEVERLRRQNALILLSAGEGIIGLDREGKITFVNPAAENTIGWEAKGLISQPLHEILHHMKPDGSAYPLEECPINKTLHDGTVNKVKDEVFWRKDGASFPVEYVSTPIKNEQGESGGAVVTFKDITEHKQAEEKLQRANEELLRHIEHLDKAQKQLVQSEKLAALGRIKAGFSHEVLNPLNIIKMSIQLMTENPGTPPEIVQNLHVMEEQANRIAKISQDFLYSTRQRPPERRKIDFNEMVNRTLGLLEHDLRLQNVAVKLTLAEELPPISADQDQLQQVVLNLLTNARDAMPGGGHLILSTEAVQANGKQWVELRVEDTGGGIAAEHLENLFDPFFTTKPEGEGTGLGLSICHGIVEAHGGSIWAENVPGGGAAFLVRLGPKEG